jgi:hypothetical protein
VPVQLRRMETEAKRKDKALGGKEISYKHISTNKK